MPDLSAIDQEFNVTASADLTRDTEEVTLIISDNDDGSYCTVLYSEDSSDGSWSVSGRTFTTRAAAAERFDYLLSSYRNVGFVFQIPKD